ncbi:acyltransferase [Acinetobacter sp. SM34]|uniref:acyltransferase family protein n=1 Tax=Acinetobacter sp. SM34 TaxID=1301620 RepID=UPI001ED9EEEF|nr:acyltransferase [Acinetobacter sp. SM34]MCG2608811.1 acyltransferase [Acinetobacter sp. SM34]
MIKPLTSLRFFFALFVLFSHLSLLKGYEHYKQIFESIFTEGFLGVSFFFILSGFILAYNYEHKFIDKKITKKEFFVARIAKIYPMHFVTMLAALILGSLIGGSGKYVAQNVLLIQSFFPSEKIFFSLNAPSWSISDEMFFYLLFPFILLLRQKAKLVILVSLFVLILAMNMVLSDEQKHYWLYISPLFRFSDFLLGMMLFHVYLKLKELFKVKAWSSKYIEFASLTLFAVFFGLHQFADIGLRYSVYYWIPMVLIILSFALSSEEKQPTYLNRFLSNKHMVWLGEISFCFYLIHLLVIRTAEYAVMQYAVKLDGLLLSLIIILITILLSAAAFKYIEKPLNRKLKERFL